MKYFHMIPLLTLSLLQARIYDAALDGSGQTLVVATDFHLTGMAAGNNCNVARFRPGEPPVMFRATQACNAQGNFYLAIQAVAADGERAVVRDRSGISYLVDFRQPEEQFELGIIDQVSKNLIWGLDSRNQERVNLETGERTPYAAPFWPAVSVTNDGSIFGYDRLSSETMLWQASTGRIFRFPREAFSGVSLHPDGSSISAMRCTPPCNGFRPSYELILLSGEDFKTVRVLASRMSRFYGFTEGGQWIHYADDDGGQHLHDGINRDLAVDFGAFRSVRFSRDGAVAAVLRNDFGVDLKPVPEGHPITALPPAPEISDVTFVSKGGIARIEGLNLDRVPDGYFTLDGVRLESTPWGPLIPAGASLGPHLLGVGQWPGPLLQPDLAVTVKACSLRTLYLDDQTAAEVQRSALVSGIGPPEVVLSGQYVIRIRYLLATPGSPDVPKIVPGYLNEVSVAADKIEPGPVEGTYRVSWWQQYRLGSFLGFRAPGDCEST